MGPAYFVIAIMGCADGSQACTRVATMPAQYADEQSCAAAVSRALVSSTDLDFPSLVAQCEPVAARPVTNRTQKPRVIPAGARKS